MDLFIKDLKILCRDEECRWRSQCNPCVAVKRTIRSALQQKTLTVGSLEIKISWFLRPSASSICNCYYPKGIKFVTRLHLGLSHLDGNDLKFTFQVYVAKKRKKLLFNETTF